jgi:enoyl-CoA hydratase/carnithine racemase
MPELIRVAVTDAVAVLTLVNPPLNLVTLELTRRLGETLDALAADAGVRVLVVTGDGPRAFCAGSDIREFPGLADDVLDRKLRRENAVFSQLDDFPRPTIAALNGLAFGGGLELAACCDLLVAGADVRVALPEIKLGVIPGSGGPVRVARRIGEGRAKELIYLGEPLDAATALGWGLLNRVVPPGEALAAALGLARTLAQGPAQALRLAKQAVDLAFGAHAHNALARSVSVARACIVARRDQTRSRRTQVS